MYPAHSVCRWQAAHGVCRIHLFHANSILFNHKPPVERFMPPRGAEKETLGTTWVRWKSIVFILVGQGGCRQRLAKRDRASLRALAGAGAF